jgi:hypothetical protein
MGTSASAVQGPAQAKYAKPYGAWQMASEHLRLWSGLIDGFRQWERETVLEREPTPEETAGHRDALKFALRSARLMRAMISDPEFPDREAVADTDAKIWQLEQSWKMLYEPMPDAEAEKLLAEVFPNRPRA